MTLLFLCCAWNDDLREGKGWFSTEILAEAMSVAGTGLKTSAAQQLRQLSGGTRDVPRASALSVGAMPALDEVDGASQGIEVP